MNAWQKYGVKRVINYLYGLGSVPNQAENRKNTNQGCNYDRHNKTRLFENYFKEIYDMRFMVCGEKSKAFRGFSLMLSLCILCAMFAFPSPVYSASSQEELVDIKAHWAEEVIRKWVSQGLAKGYGDGRFGPNDSITRAEFVTLLNRIFGYFETSEKSFPDVKAGAWYASEIAKAYQAGIIGGDNKGNMNPEAVISRQEAAVILTRAFSLTGDHLDAALKYTDLNQIAEWALGSVGTMTKRGYVAGRPGNLFAPKANLSRSEAVKMIDNVMGELINTVGVYTKVVPGNMVISSPGVTLKDTYIPGDLYLTEGIGSGTIQLIGVAVKGRTFIAGDVNTKILLSDSLLEQKVLVLSKEGTITITAEGLTEVGELTVCRSVVLSEQELMGKGFSNILIAGTTGGKEIVLNGNFDEINLVAPQTNVALEIGTVGNFIVGNDAAGARLTVKDGTDIEALTLYAEAEVVGGNRIKHAVVASGGVKMDQKPKQVTIADSGQAIAYDPGLGKTPGQPTPKPTKVTGSTQPTSTPVSPSQPTPVPTTQPTPTQGPKATPTQSPTPSPTPTQAPTASPTPTPVSDTVAPSVPTNLAGDIISSTAINLSWTASTDNIGVKGYCIYRDGVKIDEVDSTGYSDTGITPGLQVRYTIAACDAAGNVSVESSALIKAADCEYSNVSTAVEAANSGDTVLLPPGNSVWVNELSISNNKKLTLMGSGPESSVISTNASSPKGLINIGASGSRVSNIGFQLSEVTARAVSTRGKGWRVDHCRFDNLSSVYGKSGVHPRGLPSDEGSPVGLIDHCEFNDIRVVVQGDTSLMANKIWAQPLGLGTNNTVFIEDCIYNFKEFGNGIDANYGGRYVFRYNVLNDTYIEAHSVQATHCATRSWEVYGNIINQANRSIWAPIFLRGGTGVIFDNLFTGTWSSGPAVIFDNVRSFDERGDGGKADGTSPWDGNEDSTGYPARDQIGRSTDAWLWTDDNPYPPQEHDPAYLWNNKHTGKDIPVIIHNNCGLHIQENRDYYNGVGKLDYVPYPYPHPLAANDHTGKNRVLALTISGNQLTWNAITDAVSYTIQKDWLDSESLDANVNEYVISGGSVYYVKALDAEGNVLSAEGILVTPTQRPTVSPTPTPMHDTVASSVPTNLTGSIVPSTTVNLNWMLRSIIKESKKITI